MCAPVFSILFAMFVRRCFQTQTAYQFFHGIGFQGRSVLLAVLGKDAETAQA